MANDLITHLVAAAPECPDCFGSLILADELVTKELHFQLHVSIVTTEFAKSPWAEIPYGKFKFSCHYIIQLTNNLK